MTFSLRSLGRGPVPAGRWARLLTRGGFVTTALVSTLLGTTASSANDQQFRNIFFSNGYGYCDARKLAKVYRTSPWAAKAIAGRKIAAGHIGRVRRQWSRGVRIFRRNGLQCGYGSLQNDSRRFAYNDAERIAHLWRDGTKSGWPLSTG